MTNETFGTSAAGWALEPGPEECGFCLRGFHLEVAYRCADCDEPVCPVCVVTVRARGVTLCPECHDAGASAAAERGSEPRRGRR